MENQNKQKVSLLKSKVNLIKNKVELRKQTKDETKVNLKKSEPISNVINEDSECIENKDAENETIESSPVVEPITYVPTRSFSTRLIWALVVTGILVVGLLITGGVLSAVMVPANAGFSAKFPYYLIMIASVPVGMISFCFIMDNNPLLEWWLGYLLYVMLAAPYYVAFGDWLDVGGLWQVIFRFILIILGLCLFIITLGLAIPALIVLSIGVFPYCIYKTIQGERA